MSAVFDGNLGEMKRGSRVVEAVGTNLLIGKNNHSSLLAEVFSLHMFSGIIDELKINNRALSAKEVASASACAGFRLRRSASEIKL
ncbi:LamG domain-containing protein [Fontibacillus panacisegetis]|uniref:LamG domain-containing protein n=1 Tax=Fontibacillus panacisegetis TaxID=670482 RepID=UPI001FE230B4|nr:LamG domain-containing protein [Fontibacillus panacisegetis]